MFTVHPRVTRISKDWTDRFRQVDPATLGHLVEEGVMASEIKPLFGPIKVVGPAFTVRALGADSAIVHYALELAAPGDVIVVDRGGDREHACWGEMVSLSAQALGIQAAVIDGPATDVVEIRTLGFPVFCRGVSALTTKLLGTCGDINVPVLCGGVVVHPGDLILGDDNGVVVVRPDAVTSLFEKALAAQRREEALRDQLRAGKPLSRLSGASELIGGKLNAPPRP